MPVASCGERNEYLRSATTDTRDLFSKPTNPSNFNFKSTQKKKPTQPQHFTLYPQFNIMLASEQSYQPLFYI